MKPLQRATRLLEILRDRLEPYVIENLSRRFGEDSWHPEAIRRLQARKMMFDWNHRQNDFFWDANLVFNLLRCFWGDVFSRMLSAEIEPQIKELKILRNDVAHQKTSLLTPPRVDRAVETARSVLKAAGIQTSGLTEGMITIGVFQPKGGSGKSSTALFLTDFLSTVYGKRVLLVDADPQGDSSRFLLGYERRARGLQGKRAWTHLIPKAASKQLSKNDVESCLIESPALGRTRGTHLERVDVLACDDPDWENLDMALRREKNKKLLALGLKGLRHSISLLADDYDICIIDFPGTNLGPMAKMALHATDRWLFPCIPNAAGLGRLDRAIRLVGQVNLKEGGQVQPLVTVPARCPNRSRGEYKNGRAFLDEQAKANMIPPVVSREAELSERVEAENAIGTGMATGSSTINQRYGKPGKGLIDEMVPLCEEILHGLEMSFEKIDTLENHTELQEAFAGFSGGAKVNRRRRQK